MQRLWIAFLLLASLLLLPAEHARMQTGWQVLDDPGGYRRIAEIERPPLADDFLAIDSASIRTSGGQSALWLRKTLTGTRDPQYLKVIAPFLATLDLYVWQDGVLLKHARTGSQQAQGDRPIPARDFLLQLPEASGSLTLYLRLTSPYRLRPLISIEPASSLIANDQRAVQLAALLGALGMLALYNLVRFSYRRNAPAFWLPLSQLGLLLCSMHLLGMLPDWLGFLRPLQGPFGNLLLLLAMLATVGFVRSFLQWPQARPAVQRLLAGMMLLIAGCLPLTFVLDAWQTTLLILSIGSLSLPTLLLVCALHWQQGRHPVRLLTFSWALAALVSVGGIGYFLNIQPFALLPRNDWEMATILVCSILNTLALSDQQRRQLSARILAARKRVARQAEIKTKTEFLARISHDIRTPLNGVLGMAELLLGTPLSVRQKDYTQTIRSAGNELLGLLGQILDVSRLESGMIELDNDGFDYPALLDDCLGIFRPQAEQRGIELISDCQLEALPHLRSDPARVRQILLSLLEHAFKRTESGEIFLRSELRTTPQGPRLRLTLESSGTPLSPAERQALLEAELHGEDFIGSDKVRGHLAMIVTRQLAGLMGGEFGLAEPDDDGLWLELPVGLARSESAGEPATRLLEGVRVLVVDDNQTCRKVLAAQCASWGMQVCTAVSGHEALAVLRTRASLGEALDMVLLDQRMPGMNGIQLAASIKADHPLLDEIQIFMLTDLCEAPGLRYTRNAGIERVLAKPVAAHTLRSALCSALEQRAALPAERSPAAAPGSNLRVLIAEDSSVSQKVLCAMLSKLGVQPDSVGTGEAALLAIQQQHYDLVLMDCEMPVMDGFTATARLRAWEQLHRRRRTPVVALTAHTLVQQRERARRSGMDAHISKPVELARLRELLDTLLPGPTAETSAGNPNQA